MIDDKYFEYYENIIEPWHVVVKFTLELNDSA